MPRSSPLPNALHLLVIDDTPLRAEALRKHLSGMKINVQLDLIDDLVRVQKDLRQVAWDLVLFISAYDFDYAALIDIIRKANKDLPVVLVDHEARGRTLESRRQLLADAFGAGVMDVVDSDDLNHLGFVIKREWLALMARRREQRVTALLGDADRRVQTLLENSQSAVAYIHEGVHLFANDTYVRLFGHDDADSLIGVPIIDLVARDDVKNFKDFLRAYGKSSNAEQSLNFHGLKTDGSTFEAMLQLAPATFDTEPCTQVIIQTGQALNAELEAQLLLASRTDALTRLHNRQAFEDLLAAQRSQVIATKTPAALFFIGIDNIGQINASTGIAGSDAVTLAVADALRAQFGDALMARFGESTFAVLAPAMTPEGASAEAQTLLDTVRGLLIAVDKRTVQTTLSIGVAMVTETAPAVPALLDRVSQAVEKVRLTTKGVGNAFALYNPAEDASNSETALHELLVQALDQGSFELSFQSIYDTQDDQAQFFEVYVRLPVAGGQTMQPSEFMPVAQRHQLQGRLDRWVLLTACKHLKAHRQQYPNARLLINLSADSLQDPSLPPVVARLIQAIGGLAQPLVLQFAEADVIAYLQLAMANIAAFRQQGCGVSINNFGASLQAMELLNLTQNTQVKLDRRFCVDLQVEENLTATRNLVEHINQTGREVVLSYIETPADMARAWSLGARHLQGYYLQPPQPKLVSDEHGT